MKKDQQLTAEDAETQRTAEENHILAFSASLCVSASSAVRLLIFLTQ
jgi:hypothetical protein